MKTNPSPLLFMKFFPKTKESPPILFVVMKTSLPDLQAGPSGLKDYGDGSIKFLLPGVPIIIICLA